MRRRLIHLLAATLLGVAAGAVVSTGPAAAAACPAGTGVTVVVGSSVSCDANGGGSASNNFKDAGHSLENYRGFVCRIDGYPSGAKVCAGYAPTDAYWGLFWSNGTSGKWVYASEGAGTLDVPTGGWVAFVFQNSSSKTYPGVTPVGPAPAKPKPKPSAKPKPSSTPKSGAAGSATPGATTGTPTPSASTGTPKPTKSTKGAASSTTGAPTAAPDSSDEQVENASKQSDGSGSLSWVAGGLGLLLLAGMGLAVWQRRARAGRQS